MHHNYPCTIRPLTEEEGGGFLIEYPDLPGCASDGETIEQAIANGREAMATWIATAEAMGRDIPAPGRIEQYSGKWLQRAPKSLHGRLTEQARREGVSFNTYVISILAAAVGEKAA